MRLKKRDAAHLGNGLNNLPKISGDDGLGILTGAFQIMKERLDEFYEGVAHLL